LQDAKPLPAAEKTSDEVDSWDEDIDVNALGNGKARRKQKAPVKIAGGGKVSKKSKSTTVSHCLKRV
jgi:hypothetical protein